MAGKKKSTPIPLQSLDALFGTTSDEQAGIQQIALDNLHPFSNHPFKVLDDDKMAELSESVKTHGVLVPGIVRIKDTGGYEIIAGHRRKRACEIAGLKTMPVIIKDLTDDESTVIMVDSNIQREELLISEKAFAYKLKYDALKRQGKRSDLTSCQVGKKLAADEVSQNTGDSTRQILRYIHLTELIPEMLDMVDDKRLGLMLAVDISFFDKDLQKWLYEYIRENGFLKPDQIAALKNTPNLENVTQYTMIQILNSALPEAKVSGKVTLSEKKLDKYFPPHFSAVQREKVIIGLLEEWQARKDGE